MSKKESTQVYTLPLWQEVEVICIKGKQILKYVMTYEKALQIEKKPDWTYYFYQLGYSQFQTTN